MLSMVPFAMTKKTATKQVGIRLPVDLWQRTQVVAAANGQRPGAFVAEVLEEALKRGEARLRARLAKTGGGHGQ